MPKHNFEQLVVHIRSFQRPRTDMSVRGEENSTTAHRRERAIDHRVTCVRTSESEHLTYTLPKKATTKMSAACLHT